MSKEIHSFYVRDEHGRRALPIVVTIIGSSASSNTEILDARRKFQELGFLVYDPISNNVQSSICNCSLFETQKRYLGYIERADFIFAIPKPDGTFGESTTYELAFSDWLGKPIYVYDEVEEFKTCQTTETE